MANLVKLSRKFSLIGRPAIDLLLLTWVAGTMDALSYLKAGVFTANMTGNTVLLGLGIAGPYRSRLFPCAVSILSFAAGALIAAVFLIGKASAAGGIRELRAGVAMEIPFAAAFCVLSWLAPQPAPAWIPPLLIATAACALGIQSVAVRRLKVSGVVTTFISGTITTAIVSFAGKNQEAESMREPGWTSPLLLAGMFVLYVAAAACGAVLEDTHRFLAALMPLLALSAVLLRSAK